MKYQAFIVKKFYIPLEIEAESAQEAEEKAYAFISNDEQYASDDTYIYCDGEITA